MKIPETQEEFAAMKRRFSDQIDIHRKTLHRAQETFDKACGEYTNWARACRKKGFS